MAKLTKQQVDEIRQLVAAGSTQTEVAKRFHVHQTNVSYIVNFKSRRVA